MKMKYVLIFGLLALCAGPLFSAPLETWIGSHYATALVRNPGSLTNVQLKNPHPVLLPNHDDIRQLVGKIQDGLQPSIMVEALYLYKKPVQSTDSNLETEAWNETERLALFNQAMDISSLAGIEYFSASRNTMRIFYDRSWLIDNPNSKNPMPDPVFTSIPETLTLYSRQRDLTFGDNIYKYDYYSFPDAFIFVQENLTSMNAGIVPALGKNNLRSILGIFDAGDSLLIYTASMAKVVPLPGMDQRIGNSFTNRAEAIFKWYTGRADKALAENPL